MWVDTGNEKIHYDKHISKKDKTSSTNEAPVFILPGMASMAKDYWHFAERLSEFHTALVMTHRDIPPTTAIAPWTLDIRFICEDIIRILDHENVTAAHFVGESYGGMLALGMALYYPDRTLSICLINSSIAGERLLRLRPTAILNIVKGSVFNIHHYRTLAKFIFSPKSLANRASLIDEWIDLHKGDVFPQVASRKQLIAAAKFHPQKQVKHIKAPCLIIYGDQDLMVSPTNSLNLHRLLPQAEVKKITGGGHYLCYEFGDAIVKLVNDFVENGGR